ncbi:hypothetical protein BC835DRAFT_151468 [Cytidiella melzeri]|nr:hypothetical protein BC835DRAFT_151468 [Cytidiella melzeri]
MPDLEAFASVLQVKHNAEVTLHSRRLYYKHSVDVYTFFLAKHKRVGLEVMSTELTRIKSLLLLCNLDDFTEVPLGSSGLMLVPTMARIAVRCLLMLGSAAKPFLIWMNSPAWSSTHRHLLEALHSVLSIPYNHLIRGLRVDSYITSQLMEAGDIHALPAECGL